MISDERLDQIVEIVRRAGLDTETLAALRASFEDLHFTHCSDDDVFGVQAARAADGFNVYLVDGAGHCLVLTEDPARATGVVLAAVDD